MHNPLLQLSMPEQIAAGISMQTVEFNECPINLPFTATCFQVLPGYTTPLDQHEVAECWLIMQGSGVLEYAGKKFNVAKQDMLYFTPHQSHQITNDSNETLVIYSIYW
jgi:mannose-6-phosphate isomerase-like protein (cupin superfamily)